MLGKGMQMQKCIGEQVGGGRLSDTADIEVETGKKLARISKEKGYHYG